MYIPIIVILILLTYILYLRNRNKKLKNIQLMIALLQEQTLFLNDIVPAKQILEQEGDLQTIKLNEAHEVLAEAYKDGFYQIDKTQKQQILNIREKAEKLLMHKISQKKLSSLVKND